MGSGTAAGSAGAAGWDLPMSGKTGTTEAHRSAGFVGFTNRTSLTYIYDDSSSPTVLPARCAIAAAATCTAATSHPAPGSPR
ncbi:membrane carboxypeptidase (penicillin-binding protein) [Mycobacterium tuberculosis CAS/NITR204]|uniref:Membrane carboxypeptidase (Penicillin-binding protein) n=1 Tax=Mycobacterium tuberculosis CAS/NITR204 TaxID=1310114 RepID=R4MMG3_MYCTX|nr:membrane carboxypeptidase (penicillin-binding protein) [Mycobacterium tuberculosis CAS/NITR204]